jgi:N-acetylmuramic acid 6-phosphate etherase
VRAAVRLMLDEDARLPAALRPHAPAIARAVAAVAGALKNGGRLFYAGAGTSGRLGVLVASECPPTFRAPPDQVQGVIAGGQRALWCSVEGAEDDAEAGARALEFRGVRARDVVVGIAASGRTPFVWGALHAARRRDARTVLLCFNPYLRLPRAFRPDVVIAPDLGPEVLTGSTRLKAGTATKMILNMITTLAMVRLGKVVGNLMVDLNPANAKLRERATRLVVELAGVEPAAAWAALEKARWVVRDALRSFPRRRHQSGRRITPAAGSSR